MKQLARILGRGWVHFREVLHLQSVLALASAEAEILIGGQAVMEGVMMRAPHSYAVAVRRQDGTLATTTRPLVRPSERNRVWGWPLLRGLATLGQAMALGVRALRFSTQQLMEEAKPGDVGAGQASAEVGSWGMIVSLTASVIFVIAFYKFVPLLAATRLSHIWPVFGGQIMFNLADGVIRILLFLALVGGLALLPDLRRVYEYHGAEHKVVFNFESGEPVDVTHARRFTRLHPRCGTSFMIVVLLLAMALYILIPVHSFGMRLLIRILLLPLIAGAAYEIIRFGARHSRSIFALLARPGLWVQRITTQEPNDEQLACAIRSLEEAMALERSQGGEMVIG